MAGGKGGSTTTTVEVPEYIEEAAKRNLARADTISQIGYVPYYGPDVAAFTPTQEAAFQNVASQAGAFGLTTPAGGPMAGMPAPQQFAGGIQGYSSAPMYEQALGELATRRPAQFNLIESLFINPVTGQVGANVGSPVAPVIDATVPMIDTTSPVISGVGGGGIGAGGGGTDYVNIGGGQIAVGGDVYDTAGDPFGELTDQQLQDLADVGLVGTVDYGLEDGTTFVPAGSDMTEVEALRDVIGQTSDIDLARLQERADLIAAEAAGSDQSIQDIGLGLDAARDQVYGVTAGGTATSRTGMQVADAYDPRAEYFGQPTATDITATQAEDTFGADLYRSLTDPTYDPEGTVVSRALGGLLTPSSASSQPTRLETLGDFVQAAPSMGMTATEAAIAYEQSREPSSASERRDREAAAEMDRNEASAAIEIAKNPDAYKKLNKEEAKQAVRDLGLPAYDAETSREVLSKLSREAAATVAIAENPDAYKNLSGTQAKKVLRDLGAGSYDKDTAKEKLQELVRKVQA